MREALVELVRVAAGQVGAAAAVEEQGVAGDQSAVDEEALAAGRVARRVDEGDGNVADDHCVARVVERQVGVGDVGLALHPLGLVALNVHRRAHVVTSQQVPNALDRVAHQVAAEMVGVPMGREHAGDPEPLCADQIGELVDAVRRVNHDTLAARVVADDGDEAHHLASDGIVGGEVAAGEQLLEHEAVGHGAGYFFGWVRPSDPSGR